MIRDLLDRTGQVWEDVFGARVSSKPTSSIDDCAGPFLVTRTELKYRIFEQHRCVALRTGRHFMLCESPSKRWEVDPEMVRLA